jgi:hypothetical protein
MILKGFDGRAMSKRAVFVGNPLGKTLRCLDVSPGTRHKRNGAARLDGPRGLICDANGNSVGASWVFTPPGAPVLISKSNGAGGVDESIYSSTPDSAFRWDASSQSWIFNLSTRNLVTGVTYRYGIALADGSMVTFQFGLR